MTSNTERSVPEVVVTQADRDNAAGWLGTALPATKPEEFENLARVFAHHRTEAEARATRSGEVEALQKIANYKWPDVVGQADSVSYGLASGEPYNTRVPIPREYASQAVESLKQIARAALSATRSPGDVGEAEVERLARLAFEVVGYRPPNGEPWTWEQVVAEQWDIVRRLRERARLALSQELTDSRGSGSVRG
jgi:hypothetical protein